MKSFLYQRSRHWDEHRDVNVVLIAQRRDVYRLITGDRVIPEGIVPINLDHDLRSAKRPILLARDVPGAIEKALWFHAGTPVAIDNSRPPMEEYRQQRQFTARGNAFIDPIDQRSEELHFHTPSLRSENCGCASTCWTRRSLSSSADLFGTENVG
jgi:hypothetical protein